MKAYRFIPAYVAAAVALVVSVFINVSPPCSHPYLDLQANYFNSGGKLSMPRGRVVSCMDIYIYISLVHLHSFRGEGRWKYRGRNHVVSAKGYNFQPVFSFLFFLFY